jgi:LacI family transcriptional regulator
MACSDDRARQVIIACYNAGLKVPDDVAVIGVDNEDLVCELSTPPISSVALATQTAGFQAAALLDRIMQGQEKMKSQAVLIQPTHVSIRRSTDIIEVNDTELSNALKFIRNNSRKPIQVQDVVDHVMVSRRSLEQKFKNEFGSSILSEMKRVRIAHIKTMLLETILTISEIADAFGYSSVTNLARYFRQETKINPGVYRKKYTPG